MQKNLQHIAALSTLATALMAGAPAARSQSSPGGEALQEILVTATRVETTESKTPISMEVLGASQLTSKGITDFVTLTQQDSTVNFDAGNGGGFFTLRGVSGQGGIGPAIPISFDGFFYNLNYVFNNVLYDMNRVEILRGPQGTLFGRNASGGLINVVSNDPTKTFGGYGQVTFGNYNALNTEAAINLPISDTLQLRAAFASTRHAGYRTLVYGVSRTMRTPAPAASSSPGSRPIIWASC